MYEIAENTYINLDQIAKVQSLSGCLKEGYYYQKNEKKATKLLWLFPWKPGKRGNTFYLWDPFGDEREATKDEALYDATWVAIWYPDSNYSKDLKFDSVEAAQDFLQACKNHKGCSYVKP